MRVFSAEMLSSSHSRSIPIIFPRLGLSGNSGLRGFDEEKDATIIGALNMIFSCIDKPAMKSELLVRGQLLTIWQEIYIRNFLFAQRRGKQDKCCGGIQGRLSSFAKTMQKTSPCRACRNCRFKRRSFLQKI